MANDTEGAENFEISAVISRAFESIGANPLLYIGLALVLSGLPTFATSWWQYDRLGGGGAINPELVVTAGYWAPILVVWAVSVVTHAILQVSLTRATVVHLSGSRPGFGQCLAAGLTMILPMIAISVLCGIAITLAMLLLVVPGILLWLAWLVVVPVYVEERPGIFASFGRSARLTKGARWKIFLVMLVVIIALWVLSIPAGMIQGFLFRDASPIVPAAIAGAIGALGAMVTVSIQASIYVELREVKDGVAADELEAIFA